MPGDAPPATAPAPEQMDLRRIEADDGVKPGHGTAPAEDGPMNMTRTVRFLGHSTVLVDIDGTRVLTDPLLVERLGPLRRHASLEREVLQQITPDVVVISHAHQDHLHLPSLRRLVGRPPVI